MNLTEVWTHQQVVLSNTPLLFVYIQAGKYVSLRPRPRLVPSKRVDGNVWGTIECQIHLVFVSCLISMFGF